MKRILIVGPTTEPWESIRAEVAVDLERLRIHGVEVLYQCVAAGPRSIRNEADVRAAAPHVVRVIVDARNVDAAIVDCCDDPGVSEAAAVVAIPVIGPGAALRAAAAAAEPPVAWMSGDDLRAADLPGLVDRIGAAHTVVLGATGFSGTAEALRSALPGVRVLDPLDVAVGVAIERITH